MLGGVGEGGYGMRFGEGGWGWRSGGLVRMGGGGCFRLCLCMDGYYLSES